VADEVRRNVRIRHRDGTLGAGDLDQNEQTFILRASRGRGKTQGQEARSSEIWELSKDKRGKKIGTNG